MRFLSILTVVSVITFGSIAWAQSAPDQMPDSDVSPISGLLEHNPHPASEGFAFGDFFTLPDEESRESMSGEMLSPEQIDDAITGIIDKVCDRSQRVACNAARDAAGNAYAALAPTRLEHLISARLILAEIDLETQIALQEGRLAAATTQKLWTQVREAEARLALVKADNAVAIAHGEVMPAATIEDLTSRLAELETALFNLTEADDSELRSEVDLLTNEIEQVRNDLTVNNDATVAICAQRLSASVNAACAPLTDSN